MSDNSPFSRISGTRPVIIVEGDTDRIFLEGLRAVIPDCREPDYIQLGGVENLDRLLELFIKSPRFHTIPAIKIIIDCDGNEGRLASLRVHLNSAELEEGFLTAVDRSEFKSVLEDTIKVGAFLLRGINPDSPDLEGLISDSQVEASNQCRECLNNGLSNQHGYSKRLRFAERACNSADLGDVSYHSLYGRSSGIDFDSPCFQVLKDFIALE